MRSIVDDDERSLLKRIKAGCGKQLRLLITRLRCRQLRIGSRTDVRRRFVLRQATNGRVIIGRCCVIDNDMTIECRGRLTIGDGTIFGHHCTIGCNDTITIGQDYLIAELVSIRDHDHCFDRLDIPTRQQGYVSAPVVIGRNVWIGAKATIAKGVVIGENAVIGANAVVTRDIPANAVAVGVPARVIRMRDGSAGTQCR